MDHLRELQGRLFSTVFVFVLVAAAAYPFFDKIAAFLMMPLKPGQELVYLTPGGAFSFIIKVCAYVGIIGTLPVIIFHIYRFVMPAVRRTLLRTVLAYTIASLVLAVIGIAFAYYVSLPASLYFLTGFNLNHIDPMLTIDSYFSFVMTYMLAGALLFQLPLAMMIINSATPLTPAKLMKAQGKILVGSFIVAAVISPTPDALNQTLLASPIVVMYQVGIVLIWWSNRRKQKAQKRTVVARVVETPQPVALPIPPLPQTASASVAMKGSLQTPVNETVSIEPMKHAAIKSMDMVRRPQARPGTIPVPARQATRSLLPPPQRHRPTPKPVFNTLDVRSLDGVVRLRRVA